MTRITNLGRKRTYLEAGFGNGDAEETSHTNGIEKAVAPVDAPTRKKPRKGRKKAKPSAQQEGAKDPNDAKAKGEMNRGEQEADRPKSDPQTEVYRKAKRKGAEEKAAASERRRRKRAAERHAHTTCLACRQQGHTIKDCLVVQTTLRDDTGAGAPGKNVVGICYRCGSRRHNLSRCKQPVDLARPLPFASCFVCSGIGHLSSSCPKNEGRGIYPNGGSCKLCSQTSHLAKDCELRTQEQASKSAVILGAAPTEGGADEDDFHILKRRRDTVQKEETLLQTRGQHSNPVSEKPKPKVVMFK